MVDFSKAFDVIDHCVLIKKLCQLNIPDNVLIWIVNFLSNRSQVTKVCDCISDVESINMGIIQGSGLGPTLFSIMICDLKTVSTANLLCKYADDVNVLSSDNSIDQEFKHICDWAALNKMTINMTKTKEIVFHKPSPRNFISPDPIVGINQVKEAILLGVIFSDNLKFDCHIRKTLSQCSQRSFLLKKLNSMGLSRKFLEVVFKAIVLSKITYALPAWGGFVSDDCIGKINAFLKRMRRFGYLNARIEYNDLLQSSDKKLFNNICNMSHCLHHLLPPEKNGDRMLRSRGHNYCLSVCSVLHKKSFIIRSLFSFM